MSILNLQVNSFSNFTSFFIVITHNSTVNFKHAHFQLWAKGSHQSPNFETCKCSGENMPNSSCHFLNHKSVFLPILHRSLVLWVITHLYFFSWNITLVKSSPLKWRFFWDFRVLESRFVKFLMSILKRQVNSPQIFYHFSVSLHITPL